MPTNVSNNYPYMKTLMEQKPVGASRIQAGGDAVVMNSLCFISR